MSTTSRRWRHVLVGAVIAGLAIVPAQASAARTISPKAKKAIRAELRKAVKKNPGVMRRRAFLRKAALVNFNLPVTIRLRNPCDTAQNPTGSTSPGGALLTTQNCATQGTALNERTVPSAKVNLGPSLGTREVAVGGSLAAVVQFNDTYDGGALGNVSIKILPSTTKFLTTSSVPLLWNDDIADPAKRNDANFINATSIWTGLPTTDQQGCGDYASDTTPYTGGIVPPGYLPLYHGYTPSDPNIPAFATGSGVPGFPYYDPSGPGYPGPPAGYIPNYPGVDGIDQIKTGGVVGNNDWIGTNPNPFPTGSAPTNSGNPAAPLPFDYNAANTVLRTNALHLAIAPGGVSVNMSTGTPVAPGALPTAQGSQDVTLGYSGGQANLFGNIPGKNVGIDVTVNLATTINGIARIIDQDVFSVPLVSGQRLPGSGLPLPPGVDLGGAELHPGRAADRHPADRSGDHEGRQGPHREGHGLVRCEQSRPRRAHGLPDRRVGVRRLQRRPAQLRVRRSEHGPADPVRHLVRHAGGIRVGSAPRRQQPAAGVRQRREVRSGGHPSYRQFGGNAPSTTPVQLAAVQGRAERRPHGHRRRAADADRSGLRRRELQRLAGHRRR